MSYVIFGRAIKTEYLTLGTLAATGGAIFASLGGSKETLPKADGKSLQERVKEAVPIKASSSEEEQFISDFIARAEKEDSGHH